MRQLLFVTLLAFGLSLKTENPRALLELEVSKSLVQGKATLAGGFAQKFSPDMQSGKSFVAGNGCSGQCNADAKDDSKNFYECADKSGCKKSSPLVSIS